MKTATLFMVFASSGGIRSKASPTAASNSSSDIGNGPPPFPSRPPSSFPSGTIGRPGGSEGGIPRTLCPRLRGGPGALAGAATGQGDAGEADHSAHQAPDGGNLAQHQPGDQDRGAGDQVGGGRESSGVDQAERVRPGGESDRGREHTEVDQAQRRGQRRRLQFRDELAAEG